MEPTPNTINLVKTFTAYVVKELKIETNVAISLLFEHEEGVPSAGGYLPTEKKILVVVKNRAIADVMRTLAHELTHHRQNELGKISPEDNDNQELEDEANVFSGRYVRWFGRKNLEIYADIA